MINMALQLGLANTARLLFIALHHLLQQLKHESIVRGGMKYTAST